ncbi:MAG TPA: diaminopimelate decarboxylase [Allocoleopsis sp.]
MVSTANIEITNTGSGYIAANQSEIAPNQALLPLTSNVNEKHHLEIGGCDVTNLVAQFGTPLYIVDEKTVRTACSQYREAFKKYYPGESQVLYASKAWNCLGICAIVSSEQLGIDVVSAGELYTALIAGLPPEKIYLHGNNKSLSELEMAVNNGVTIVVDNWLELEKLAKFTTENPIKIMLRLTPGIECHTHEYIRTGHLDSKFGFDPNQIEKVFNFVGQNAVLKCMGLHAHIGSQIFEKQPHQDLAEVLVEWCVKAQNYGLPITELNIGGGLGIRYTENDDPPSIDEWVKVVSESMIKACEKHNLPYPKLLSEPGRSIIATACITAYTVGGIKVVPDIRTYVSVDGGMSDNPRPITYQSVYRTAIANKMTAECTEIVTIAGKHCESGDILIKDAHIPQTTPGDILVVLSTGAYNYSMASNYNRLPRPAAVLVNDGEANLIIERETLEDLISKDHLPDRLIN